MVNPVIWFTDLLKEEQLRLCDKYKLDPHNVRIDEMEIMFVGEFGSITTNIDLFYVVNSLSTCNKIRLYIITNNQPSLLFSMVVNRGDSILDSLKERIAKESNYQNYSLKLL